MAGSALYRTLAELQFSAPQTAPFTQSKNAQEAH
jgi:hypothetical protein